MSESRGFPAELLSFALFGALGVAVTAAALAGFAHLMVGHGCSGSVVPVLATAAVCMVVRCVHWRQRSVKRCAVC